MRGRTGPMFVMFDRLQQIRVGKPSEGVAVLELCEDAKKGDQLVLTQRDLGYLTFATEQRERETPSRGRSEAPQ